MYEALVYIEDKSMTDYNSIQIYQSSDGETCVDVRFEKETVWLTQA